MKSAPFASLAAVIVLASASPVRAGGMYFTDRGIRPMGRGYAFVAGADDAQSLWYNPAGLAWAGNSVFLDVGLTLMDADFTRINGGGMELPTVSLERNPLPVPMLALTHDFGLDDFTFGLGAFAPNLIPFRWPDEVVVDDRPEPAPQRYSLYDLDGSAAVHIAAGAAWRPIPELSIGADVQFVVGSLTTEVALSACDRVVCTFPESPEWDGRTQLSLPVFSVFGTLGATYANGPIRVGLSFQIPHQLGGTATLKVRLPEAALFDGATVEGDQADVSLWMPWILRMGVEVRPIHPLRVELAAVIEGWGVQKALEVRPKDIYMRDVTAIGDYRVGDIEVPRNMQNVLSLRLGGAYAVDRNERFTVRAGANYETSGFSDEMLSPLTLDSSKLILGLGLGWEIVDGFFVDASFAHVFVFDREVTNSRVPQPNPIRPPPVAGAPGTDAPVYVGNGTYAMSANQFGLGLRWSYGPPRRLPRSEAGPEGGEAPRRPGAAEPPTHTSTAPDPDQPPSTDSDADPDQPPSTDSDADPDQPTSDQDVPWYYRDQPR